MKKLNEKLENNWLDNHTDKSFLYVNDLLPESFIDIESGGQVKVIKELGRGGQGIVYLCEFKGQQYALKWYTNYPSDAFYKNLKANIDAGPPSKSGAFLWPLMLAKKQYNSFGYVMQLRSAEYKEFVQFLLGKACFASVSAMLNAALQMCKGFYDLHLKGYSCQHLYDDNFFINPQTGDLLICDNDNVTAHGDNLGMLGKLRYMAPEVVLGTNKPDKYSDYFSLSVLLFRLFLIDHPLEGQKVLKVPCLTEAGEKKHFGSEALFIYDKENKENMPVRGVHNNVIRRWLHYPDILREAFIEVFSQPHLKDPQQRWTESQWEKVLVNLRNRLVISDSGSEMFIDGDNKANFSIQTSSYGTIALSPKKQVYLGQSKEPIAKVRTIKKNPGVWALQNIMKEKWVVETASGKLKEVISGEIMPVKPGLKITFPGGEKGIIV